MMKTSHRYRVGEAVTTVTVQPEGDGFLVQVGERVYDVRAQLLATGQISLSLDRRQLQAQVLSQRGETQVAIAGEVWRLQPVNGDQRRPVTAPESGSGRVEAAMPGAVRAVLVSPGDVVSQGQPLLLLEAMKMEMRLVAPCAGLVSQIKCRPGQIVERGTLLLEIDCTIFVNRNS